MALPIWNFVLPIYSFWHFDDFTWGETRKLDGTNETKRSGANEDTLPESPPLSAKFKLWHAWEKERLKLPGRRIPKTERLNYTKSPPQMTAQHSQALKGVLKQNTNANRYSNRFNYYQPQYTGNNQQAGFTIPELYPPTHRLHTNYLSHPPPIMQSPHSNFQQRNMYQNTFYL